MRIDASRREGPHHTHDTHPTRGLTFSLRGGGGAHVFIAGPGGGGGCEEREEGGGGERVRRRANAIEPRRQAKTPTHTRPQPHLQFPRGGAPPSRHRGAGRGGLRERRGDGVRQRTPCTEPPRAQMTRPTSLTWSNIHRFLGARIGGGCGVGGERSGKRQHGGRIAGAQRENTLSHSPTGAWGSRGSINFSRAPAFCQSGSLTFFGANHGAEERKTGAKRKVSVAKKTQRRSPSTLCSLSPHHPAPLCG